MPCGIILRHFEVCAPIEDFPRSAVFKEVHLHRAREELPKVEEGDREGAWPLCVGRMLRKKAQLSMRIIVDGLNDVRLRCCPWLVVLPGKGSCAGDQLIKGEAFRLSQ